jgi:hypothetical protein
MTPSLLNICILLSVLCVVLAFVPSNRRAGVLVTKAIGSDVLDSLKEYDNLSEVTGGKLVDEAAMLAASTFPIKPDDIIRLTKRALVKGVGTEDPSILADNFQFCAPVVGPLSRDQYLNALGSFKLLDAFPDMNNNFHFIRVDPFEPNRCYWHSRATATHTGPLMGKPATKVKLELPPQCNSLTFNEDGLITQLTIGYVLDRRVGNTGGLGGAFGYFYGTGNPLPIPECQPFKPSKRFKFLNLLGKVAEKFKK